MQTSEDYRRLTDPEFLAERSRVRQELEHPPACSAARAKLTVLYEGMTTEYAHRASVPVAHAVAAQVSGERP